ncbi:drebrin-like isoform X7 [Python bivittatus]|uniref:Drebrin-like isoform X7 n=1 Tax=Python bivittatus TaxID=176946 RepID=A0A9F2RCE7_PYTBI|nr:drebrin-like isoform X7 [Python bivittatus]
MVQLNSTRKFWVPEAGPAGSPAAKEGRCLVPWASSLKTPARLTFPLALFAYEKSNELKLLDSGGGGPDELAKRFQSGRIMYGLCRLSESAAGTPRIVLIHWVGEKVSDSQQEACAGHLPAIRAFFKEAHLVLKASRAEEVTREGLTRRLSLAAPSGAVFSKKGMGSDPQELVGTNYQKTNPLLEILHTKRSSFWAQAEREEEQRREEERRRAQEERRHWECLRMEEERREAAERERRVQEKEKLIQEQRKQQAQRDAEEHRWEEARRKEQAKAISGMSLQRQPSEKARQEVAMPGLQQPHPPRGFFQKRDRLGSASRDPGPGGSMGVAPGQAGSILPSVRNGTEEERWRRGQGARPSPTARLPDGRLA